MASLFDWDQLLSNPGLSHLAVNIFLRLDSRSLAKAKKVCQSWRDLINKEGIWRQLSSRVASTKLHHVAALDISSTEDMAELCHSLYLNRAWLDESTKVEVRRTLMGQDAHIPWILEDDNFGWAGVRSLYTTYQVEDDENFESYPPNEKVCCLDSHAGSGRLAVGTELELGAGMVHLWDAAAKTKLAAANTGSAVSSVGFHPSGDVVASSHVNGTMALWNIEGKKDLVLVQEIVNKKFLRPPKRSSDIPNDASFSVSLGWHHILYYSEYEVKAFAMEDGDGDGTATMFKEKFHLETVDTITCAAALVGEPGLAVVGDSNLMVLDLDRGAILQDMRMACVSPRLFPDPWGLSECTERGLLAVAYGIGYPLSHHTPCIALMTTAGLRLGLAAATVLNLPMQNNAYSPSVEAKIMAMPGKIHVFSDTVHGPALFEYTLTDKEEGEASRVVINKVVRRLDWLPDIPNNLEDPDFQ